MFYKYSVLPSGLQVITERIENVRSVALGFWVRFGSRDEDPEMNGAAHFLEHLLFKGTDRRSAVEISSTFESLGAEFNAFSAKEYTTYHARLLDQHMPVAVDVLSDMLRNSLLRPEDVEAERQVIIEEIRLHDDTPDDHIHDLFMQRLFPGHSLGRPVAGSEEIVSGMSRDRLLKLYRQVYQPSRIVVAATGSIDHDELIALLNAHWGDGGAAGAGAGGRSISVPSFRRDFYVQSRLTEQAHIVMGGPGLRAHDPDRFALLVLDCALGGGMSSRLFQEIREKHALVYSVYSHYAMYTETGYFSIYAGTRPTKAQEVIERIQGEIKKLVREGLNEEELTRCREHIKGQLVLSFESTANRMFRIGKAQVSEGEILSLDEIVERIDSVTLPKVNELANRLFDLDKMVTTVIGPFEGADLELKAG